MEKIQQILNEKYKQLKQIQKICKQRIANAPEGTARVVKRKHGVQFYHCMKNDDQGRYLRKNQENEELIRCLIQNSYDKKILRLVEKWLHHLEPIINSYRDDELDTIYYKEHPLKRPYITPIEPTWEQLLQDWKSKPYIGKGFPEGFPVILTERGERVRSKSEKILADYFYRHGIEYKYECPLYLKGIGTVYPDFTFLSQKTYKEIYWEHNGMMGDGKYSMKAVRKIHTYEDNGIYLGENLILTFETEQTILSTAQIERLVRKYLVL